MTRRGLRKGSLPLEPAFTPIGTFQIGQSEATRTVALTIAIARDAYSPTVHLPIMMCQLPSPLIHVVPRRQSVVLCCSSILGGQTPQAGKNQAHMIRIIFRSKFVASFYLVGEPELPKSCLAQENTQKNTQNSVVRQDTRLVDF